MVFAGLRIDDLDRLDGVQEGVHDTLIVAVRRPQDVPAHGLGIENPCRHEELHALAQVKRLDFAILLRLPRLG